MNFPLARSFEQFSKYRQVLSMLLNVARESSYWLSESMSCNNLGDWYRSYFTEHFLFIELLCIIGS